MKYWFTFQDFSHNQLKEVIVFEFFVLPGVKEDNLTNCLIFMIMQWVWRMIDGRLLKLFFSRLQQVPPELENAKALIVLSLSHNK